MIVTINTDASWNKQESLAGYAFWMVCNYGRCKMAGILRRQVTRPEIAEFRCILNAMHVLGKLMGQQWPGVSRVIVNTDCLNVIHLVKNDKAAIKQYGLAVWGHNLVQKYNDIRQETGLDKITFEFRHVPSHRDTKTKRAWVNQWCDTAAKEQMRLAVKQKKELENGIQNNTTGGKRMLP